MFGSIIRFWRKHNMVWIRFASVYTYILSLSLSLIALSPSLSHRSFSPSLIALSFSLIALSQFWSSSSLTLTCPSLIKSTVYPNLVIFISKTSVEFVIFFLSLLPQLLQIQLSPANLTIAIHCILASHKHISTNFNAFKIHWHVSLQTLQNINTSHQHSKTYTGFLSNKELITKSVFSHTYKLTTYISLQSSFISVTFCFYAIFWFTCSFHSICPIMTGQKGFFCHRSTTLEFTPSWYIKLVFSIPIFRSRLKTHLFKIAFPPNRLFPISLDCLPRFWFFLFSLFYARSNDTQSYGSSRLLLLLWLSFSLQSAVI